MTERTVASCSRWWDASETNALADPTRSRWTSAFGFDDNSRGARRTSPPRTRWRLRLAAPWSAWPAFPSSISAPRDHRAGRGCGTGFPLLELGSGSAPAPRAWPSPGRKALRARALQGGDYRGRQHHPHRCRRCHAVPAAASTSSSPTSAQTTRGSGCGRPPAARAERAALRVDTMSRAMRVTGVRAVLADAGVGRADIAQRRIVAR